MDIWGTAIQSNDVSARVYMLFFELFNKGDEVKEISEKLIKDYQETIHNEDESTNFWLALAKAQWETGQLDPAVLSIVENIIMSGKDLAARKRLGADIKDSSGRQQKLDKFLALIQSENKKPKKKKKPPRQIFRQGECLAIKMKCNDPDLTYYVGAIVLECEEEAYLVAKVGVQKLSLPVIEDFIPYKEKLNSIENISDMFMGEYKLSFPGWYLLRAFRKFKNEITSVGVLDLSVSFGSSEDSEATFGITSNWMNIPFKKW
jgi:hypothetical protein